MFTIPASSAEWERGFSHVKRIKSTERNCLGESSLSDLLTIKLEGPTIEMFNPVPAINAWLGAGQRPRRTNFMDRKSRGQRNTPSATNTEDILLIDDKKQGSSVEVATTLPGEEIEVPGNEEIVPHVMRKGILCKLLEV